MSKKSCYSPETTLGAVADADEFSVESMRAGVLDIRRLGLGKAVPQVFVKLDRMSRVSMSASRRLGILHELKRPLLKLAFGLPKPVVSATVRSAGSEEMMLEQRLYCLVIKNLRQALRDLDFSEGSFSAEMDKRRRWVLRNLFRFFGRQVAFGLLWRYRVPEHTWSVLHDLYSYMTVRGIARPGVIARRQGRGDDFDPQQEYLRILLMGLAGCMLPMSQITPGLLERLDAWAVESRLGDPHAYIGDHDLFIVELSKDLPPRQVVGVLTESFRGWVLIPSPGFIQFAGTRERQDSGVVPLNAVSFVAKKP